MNSVEERFWSKVVKLDGREDFCWLWTTAHNKGYGVFHLSGRSVIAPRFAYAAMRGPIPDGMTLDHLCRMPLCVNPAHLEAVTKRVNNLRGVSPFAMQARQTACIRGHELATTIRDGRPRRFCPTCRHARRAANGWKS